MITMLRKVKNKTKRVLSIIISAMMLITMSVPVAFATDADTDASSGTRDASGYWSSYIDTEWYNDTSTTFTITTAEQLAGLAKLVSDGNSFAGKTVKLGADIDLSTHYWLPIGGNRSIAGNTPTGTRFEGTFDGGAVDSSGKISNYNVTGLTISWNTNDLMPDGMSVSDSNYSGFGLFGVVGADGLVENLNVSGSITSNARMYAVGGVVGYCAGDILNCHNAVTINISSSYSARTGGVAGELNNASADAESDIKFCSNTASVQGARDVGGIVGAVYCTNAGGSVVDNVYNTGSVSTVVADQIRIGGIVGTSQGYVSHTYSVGSIDLTSNGGDAVGGLVGYMANAQASLSNSYAANSFSGTVSGAKLAFGAVNGSTTPITNVLWCPDVAGSDAVTQPIASGYSSAWGRWTRCGTSTVSGLQGTTGGMVIVYTTIQYGYSIIPNQVALQILSASFTRVSGTNNSYPILRWQVNGLTYADLGHTGSGTQDDPWRIYSQQELEDIANSLNEFDSFEGDYFILMNNVTLGSTWSGIGSPTISSASTGSPYVSAGRGFAGTLDGNGKMLSITRSASTSGTGGIVNYLEPDGTVENLTVSGSLTVTGSVDAVGGVVGYNSGTVDHVTSAVTVSAGNAYNVGGIAGFNDCYYTDMAKGVITNCRNTSTVTGYSKVGGIVGENAGTVNACSNIAEVTASSSGRTGVGGIVGRNGNNNTAVESGIIANCYNTAVITNQNGSWSGGISGFEDSLSKIFNCYNTADVTGISNTDAICGRKEGTLSNCYYKTGIEGVQGYDGATSMSADDMEAVSFAETLNGATTTSTSIWQQTAGSYPYLLANGNVTPVDRGFTIEVTAYPSKTEYTAGETLSTEGLKIKAESTDGTETDVTGYTVSPARVLDATDKSGHVYGVYDGMAYSVPFAITVTGEVQPVTSVYLSNTGNDENAGTSNSAPVKTLGKALELVGNNEAVIYVMNTITIDNEQLYGSTSTSDGSLLATVKAADGAEGTAMFEVTGTNNRLGSIKFDGTGFNSVFHVTGSLSFRNNAVVSGAATAFDVASGGSLVLNRSSVTGNINLASATESTAAGAMEIGVSTGQTFSFNGTVYLGSGAYITFSDPIPTNINVVTTDTSAGTVIAKSAGTYELTEDDVEQLNVNGGNVGVELDGTQIVIS
jgi:hypothetical protein